MVATSGPERPVRYTSETGRPGRARLAEQEALREAVRDELVAVPLVGDECAGVATTKDGDRLWLGDRGYLGLSKFPGSARLFTRERATAEGERLVAQGHAVTFEVEDRRKRRGGLRARGETA